MDPTAAALTVYAERHSAPEPAYLHALASATRASAHAPHMLCSAVQGRLLALLSRLTRPRRVLELGTYTGYATLCLAEGLHPEGHIHTVDIDTGLQAIRDKHFVLAGMQERISCHSGRALDVVPRLKGDFDLVYIDADKANYPAYLDLVVGRLAPGGLLLADNVLHHGTVLQCTEQHDRATAGLHAFNRALAEHPGLFTVLLPLRDGLSVAWRVPA